MVDVPNQSYSGFTQSLGTLSQVAAVAGVATAAIGAYYGAEAARDQAKSQALALEFQQTMAHINARAAEFDAQQILRESARQAGRSGMQYRAIAQAARTRLAAGGIESGVGSAAEVQASIEFSRQADRVSITSSGMRAANNVRMGAVNARNQAIAAGTSAQNIRLGANSINPWMAGTTSLLQGVSGVAQSYARSRRADLRYTQGDR